MIRPDLNVLVYAHRKDSVLHRHVRTWLDTVLGGQEAFRVADVVLSGFLRVVTHPKIFDPPTPLATTVEFVETLHSHPLAVTVRPGARHGSIFLGLCRKYRLRGNLIADAFLAALAIEGSCEWVSTDRDFARCTELRWHCP